MNGQNVIPLVTSSTATCEAQSVLIIRTEKFRPDSKSVQRALDVPVRFKGDTPAIDSPQISEQRTARTRKNALIISHNKRNNFAINFTISYFRGREGLHAAVELH